MKKKVVFLIAVLVSWGTFSQLDAGDELAQTGNWKEAIKEYQKAPQNAVREFKLAQAYSQLGNNSKAISYYRKGFLQDSTTLKPMYEYGKLLINSQQFVDAIPVFESLKERQVENASFHYYLGEAWSGLNQIDNAIKAYNSALTIDEDYRAARLELIKNLIQNRDFIVAVQFAKQGIKMDSTDVKMNSYLAQAYMNAKWYSKAVPVFERLFTLGNNTEYNRNGLAFSYFQEKQFEKAIDQYLIYMEDYDDKKPGIYFNLSIAYMKLERFDEAIDAIETAIALKRPLLDREYVQLAAVHARNQDIKNAFFALKMAQKERTDDALINYQLAVAADRYFEDKKTIIPYYEKYLELHGEKSDYGTLAAERLSDLKEAVFMNGDD
ncbi:MAG: tetratricopeptide repeat protein [Nonlabens sp.]|uniref:tetratricopeptide repeat protein n=1 Tax=Nonlabens sp. TaxID=1888209 RepID=UPI003EF690F2